MKLTLSMSKDDRIFILGWTIALNCPHVNFCVFCSMQTAGSMSAALGEKFFKFSLNDHHWVSLVSNPFCLFAFVVGGAPGGAYVTAGTLHLRETSRFVTSKVKLRVKAHRGIPLHPTTTTTTHTPTLPPHSTPSSLSPFHSPSLCFFFPLPFNMCQRNPHGI